jgi:NDP-sugar pyrophosphorylase family protein
MILPELFAELPAAFASRCDPQQPWLLLGEALDAVLAELPGQRIEIAFPPDVHLAGDRIVIGKGTRIHPTAVIEGPVRIGEDVEIRPGAYIRGGAWIGDRCVIGANSELKRAILLDGAKAPHLSYVGDSILGREVNLGAGTVLSNFRHDGGEIVIPLRDGGRLRSGRRKLGAVLGDRVMTGCNCVLHPGSIVGRGTQIYPGVQLRAGVWPAGAIVKLRQEIEVVAER